MVTGPLDFLPLWSIFAGTIGIILLALEGGYRLGRYRRQRSEEEKEGPVGAMVGAGLGLLGFLLAFTFGLAASRFDARRQVLLDEVNAIGTCYLRAGLLPEPEPTVVRELLREYVDVRLQAIDPSRVEAAIRRSEEIQGQLWAQALAAGKKAPGSIMAGLFIQALNEVIDLHSKRVTVALRNRIPAIIWIALCLVTVLTMAQLGYHAGLTRTSRSLAILGLAVTFAVVIWLIAELDRPHAGLLSVSQQGMIDLRNSMTP